MYARLASLADILVKPQGLGWMGAGLGLAHCHISQINEAGMEMSQLAN